MSINVDVHKVAHGSKVAPDDDLRRSATILAKATGTNFGTDAIGAIMAKYDTDGDGQISFDEFKAKATDMVRPAARHAHSFARPPPRQPCLRRRCRPWPSRRAGGERRAVRARGGAAG